MLYALIFSPRGNAINFTIVCKNRDMQIKLSSITPIPGIPLKWVHASSCLKLSTKK